MNPLVYQSFCESGDFEEALVLSEHPEKSWEEILQLMPDCPRGWFELSRLAVSDRIDFTCSFWLKTIPYRPSIQEGLEEFFSMLDDVGLILALNGKWTPYFVYSLRDGGCFFRGLPPISQDGLLQLKKEIPFPLPQDWISFLQIHNGFGKLLTPGILPSYEIGKAKGALFDIFSHLEKPLLRRGILVDPESLIPFYEDFGFNSFQCFFADWYPRGEIGNVYFSGIDYTISDTTNQERWNESGAFSSFSEWLIAFLEGMGIRP